MTEGNMIDLRSDTITKPTEGMLEHMFRAPVGDDVLGDDPSVQALQEKVAGMFGKEAGLFVPSGTMSNQIAIKLHTQPGTEIICNANSHIYIYEGGGPALLSGVLVRPLPGESGILNPEEVEANIKQDDNVHYAPTSLVEVENTHNRGGGTITDLGTIASLREICDRHSLPLHLDGARIWNAHRASGIPLDEYGKYFDTISVCFSKGLGAPVGSMLLGSREHIRLAQRYRKVFGGGMRQAGYLAAAADYALDHHLQRMSEDHENARCFADIVNESSEFRVDTATLQTNIVMIDIRSSRQAAETAELLKQRGLAVLPVSPKRLRAVFHLHISSDDAVKAAQIFKQI